MPAYVCSSSVSVDELGKKLGNFSVVINEKSPNVEAFQVLDNEGLPHFVMLVLLVRLARQLRSISKDCEMASLIILKS
jgi:hypothetical protein